MCQLSPQYLAGLFDGEGNVEITNKLALRIGIANTYKEVLTQIQSQYGGNVSVTKVKPNRNWKIGYCLRMAGPSARSFLKDVLPYLVIKKERVLTASQLNPVLPGHRIPADEKENRHRLRRLLQSLNRRGQYWEEETCV